MNVLYRRSSIPEISSAHSHFDWLRYFKAFGSTSASVLVKNPASLLEIDRLMASLPLRSLKNYLKWRVIEFAASHLSGEIGQTYFDFFGRRIYGLSPDPRWEQCLSIAGYALPDAISEILVEETHGRSIQRSARDLANLFPAALRERIMRADWLDEATREQALEKLNALRIKVAFPARWADYSRIRIKSDSYFMNQIRTNLFTNRMRIGEIGRTEDREASSCPPGGSMRCTTPFKTTSPFRWPFYSNPASARKIRSTCDWPNWGRP